MTYSGDSEIVPTERAVVTLWKASAAKPNQVVQHDGLSCKLIPYLIPGDELAFENKRQVLDHIQKHCSIDFLRQQGLNASAAVLLRKTNMNKLLQAWQLWKSQTLEKIQARSNSPPLESIFTSLLHPKERPMIAGILHESSFSELPCFSRDSVRTGASLPPPSLRICLFLGAVRDMHPHENDLLRKCCTSQCIPLVHVRLGPVPEFTSKIIAVAVFHHVNGRLGPAMWELKDIEKQGIREVSSPSIVTATLPPAELHVILTLGMDPSRVVAESKQRTRLLWMLVRVTVSTLWRSRLAGNTSRRVEAESSSRSSSPLNNTLTILFRDETSLTLQQDDLVKVMADQHQAAPSEYQIIKAINDKLGNELLPIKRRISSMKRAYSVCLDFTRRHHQQATDQHCDAVEQLDLVESCYKARQDLTATGKVLVLLGDDNTTKKVATGLLQKTGIEPIPSRLIHPRAVDWEAASVVITQHLMYQYRLLPVLFDNKTTERDLKRPRIE